MFKAFHFNHRGYLVSGSYISKTGKRFLVGVVVPNTNKTLRFCKTIETAIRYIDKLIDKRG